MRGARRSVSLCEGQKEGGKAMVCLKKNIGSTRWTGSHLTTMQAGEKEMISDLNKLVFFTFWQGEKTIRCMRGRGHAKFDAGE